HNRRHKCIHKARPMQSPHRGEPVTEETSPTPHQPRQHKPDRPSAAAQRIAAALEEPKTRLVQRVIDVIGLARAEILLQKTLEVEATGGLFIDSGKRRRTPGGVFFKLVKDTIPLEEQTTIFPPLGPRPRPVWEEAKEAALRLAQKKTLERIQTMDV